MSTTQSSTIDPFAVTPPPPLWKSLPIFLLFLPQTLLCLCVGLLVGLIFIPIYPKISQKWKDRSASWCNFWMLCALRMPVKTIVHDPKALKANIFVAPHTCLFEACILLWSVGHYRPITAEFSKSIPIFKHFIHALDPLYVMRTGKGTSNIVDALCESVNNTHYRHLIFPEGTYTNGKALLQFKSGAFVPGKAVAPIIFEFSRFTPFWNREESGFLTQLYRTTSRFYTPVIMHYLPLYEPSDEEKSNPKLYAENVRQLLATQSQRQLSNLSLQDSPNFRMDTKKRQTSGSKIS